MKSSIHEKHVQVTLPENKYLSLRIAVAQRKTTFQGALAEAIDLWLKQQIETAEEKPSLSRWRGILKDKDADRVQQKDRRTEKRREERLLRG